MPGRRAVIVIAPERFRDEELAEPRRALEAAGCAVSVASTRPGTASGMLGARVPIDLTVNSLDAADWDLAAIAGGGGAPDHLWESAPLRAFVQAMRAAGKPLGAICLSPPVLARAGLLEGRRATTWPDRRAILELKRGGATYVQDAVVTDGPIVTANGPEGAPGFGAALVTLLGK